ncbi:MAG: galactokinase family protein [Myxococcota bacterium]|nr:galactokinase family protein [Myxococcota bacterium]
MSRTRAAARYPGRICLLGEHCDWYGGASLAAPLPMGVTVTVTDRPSGLSCHAMMDDTPIHATWPGPQIDPAGGPLRFVPAAAAVLLAAGIPVPPLHLSITADLPTGRGFSSSAALCLALCDAMAQRAGVVLPPPQLAELAFVVEHDQLGVACGRLDQLACVAGAPVLLRWSDGHAPLQPLPPARPLFLVAAAFSAPRDTPGILSALRRPLPEIDAALSIFAQGAEDGAAAILRGDLPALGAAMSAAQSAYETLLEPCLPALAAPQLRQVCTELREWGALGAKFSGAGGDGSVIALLSTQEEAARVAGRLQETGLAAFSLIIPAGAGHSPLPG